MPIRPPDVARGGQSVYPVSEPSPGREEFSLKLLPCFEVLEGGTAGSRRTRDGPAALTHLEEKQVGL